MKLEQAEMLASPQPLPVEPGQILVLRPGMLCPVCAEGRLDYNGLLILTCPHCGYQDGGGGCT